VNRRQRHIALRLALVAALVLGVLRAGSAYFVCQQTFAACAPCCAQHATGGDATESVDRAPCCIRDQVRALPSGTEASARTHVPASPLVASLAPVVVETHAPIADVVRDGILARDGPPRDPRAPRSMVFLL